MKLKDKVVLITGSSNNIGKATAIKFAKEGAKIVVNSIKNTAGGEAVAEEIKVSGGEAIYVRADVSKQEGVDKLFGETVQAFNTLDILINNAGRAVSVPFLETTEEHWLDLLRCNFLSTVLCSKEAAKIMLHNGSGKIINTSSVRGIQHTGRESIMAYSAAKAAVINFTKTLAKELAPKISVNAVAPGFVYTTSYDNMPRQLKDAFINSTLIKRWINVNEIADAFLYLANAEAVTGEVLVVDGGFTLK